MLIPPGDKIKLKEVIEKLIEDSGLRKKIGEAQRRNIVSNYSLIETGRRYLSLLDGLIMN
jgi:glycosyltransferase involved in cell wall biosynthesis